MDAVKFKFRANISNCAPHFRVEALSQSRKLPHLTVNFSRQTTFSFKFKKDLMNLPSFKQSNIINLCKNGYLFDALSLLNITDSSEITLKPILYATLLQSCTKHGTFNHGLQLHSHLIKSGLETDRFVGNSLLALYFKLSSNFRETRRVFNGLYFKDVVSWTSMITGYVRAGKSRKSVDLFKEMMGFGVVPNGFTLSAVVKASGEVGDLNLGFCVHGIVLKRGFDSETVIVSGLIDMYGRNYQWRYARQVFDEMIVVDAICWTSVISAMTRNDVFEEALGLFYTMGRCYGLCPDGFTFGTVLTACGNLERLKQGKEVHGKIVTVGICGNVVVDSSLVDMYGKCGSVDDGRRVFDRMAKRNSVSWCALLGGYCQKGDFESVLELFRVMEIVDLYSFGTVLRACSGLAAVRQGKEIHCQYLRRGGWRDVIVESALVDLYAKSGCIDFANRLYAHMTVKNLITWNSMIVGFAQNGRGIDALGVFEEMIKEGFKPDSISFTGILFACSHAGLVDQGRKYFISLSEDYGLKPGIQHYSCMVDLLSRAGEIEEAEILINKSEFRDDTSLWASLLGACTTSTNSTAAERVAKKMMELDPGYHLSYVLLTNIYRAVGRWDDSFKIWKIMQDRGVHKTTGKSWTNS